MRSVYLDNAASTRTDPEAVAVMLPYFTEHFANPSSQHRAGGAAAAALGEARRRVANLIGAADESEIVFTSGGSEANNLALAQACHCGDGRDEMVVSAVEHKAILAVCRRMETFGFKIKVVGVDSKGRLDIAAYEAALGPRTALVSLMAANNETGTRFPVRELAAKAHNVGALFHSDATQAVGHIAIELASSGIDMLSLSAHKLHGPKGVGALYVRKGGPCTPQIFGGHQERGRRAGTQNVPAIVGFGKAAELAGMRMTADALHIAALRDGFETEVLRRIPDCAVLGDVQHRLPGISCIAFDCAESEIVLDGLDKAGIAASSGSACASGAIEPSHVIRAMRVAESAANGVVRFSFSRDNVDDDVDYVLARLPDIVAKTRAASSFAAHGPTADAFF